MYFFFGAFLSSISYSLPEPTADALRAALPKPVLPVPCLFLSFGVIFLLSCPTWRKWFILLIKREISWHFTVYGSNQYNLLKELSNSDNCLSPNPSIRSTVYLGDYLYAIYLFKCLEIGKLFHKYPILNNFKHDICACLFQFLFAVTVQETKKKAATKKGNIASTLFNAFH